MPIGFTLFGNLPPYRQPSPSFPFPEPGTIPRRPIFVPEPLPPATAPPVPPVTPPPVTPPPPSPPGASFGPVLGLPGRAVGSVGMKSGLGRLQLPNEIQIPPSERSQPEPRFEMRRLNNGDIVWLLPQPLSPEAVEALRKIEEGAKRRAEVGQAIGDFLFGKAETTAASKAVGGGFFAKKVAGQLAQVLLGSDPLGGGEEDAIARMNQEARQRRDELFQRLLAALSVTPPVILGGPRAELLPMELADP